MKNITNLKTWSIRAKNATAALLFLAAYTISMVAPFVPVATVAAIDPVLVNCISDVQLANDEPGQKDLSRFCDDGVTSGVLAVSWNWDEIAWSGSNTGDACALFDTDADGNVNHSVCVTVSGSPATQTGISPRIYSCTDGDNDNCTGAVLRATPYLTTCSVTQQATDPFSGPQAKKKGAAYPNDTVATCFINLSEVGDATAVKDVCSYPSQQPTSDPSDCVIISTGAANPVIELKKDIEPNTDTGRFNLRIDQTVDIVKQNAGDGDTTGEVEFTGTGKTFVIEETAYTGTLLSNYSTLVKCSDDEDPTAAPFFSETRTGTESRTATITIPNGVVDITCVFVNTRLTGTVTLIKSVTNNNGGTLGSNDFGLTIGGHSVKSGQALTLPAGVPVAISESGATGYSFVSVTGDARCPAALGGNVTPVSGQNITCTITNDDLPAHLTLTKSIIKDNGGTASATDWTLNASGPTSISGVTGNATVTNAVVSAGTYNLSETGGPTGYTPSNWVCEGGTQVGASVTLALNESATCAITNDDQPGTLIVNKVLTNDNGGTKTVQNFSYTVNGGLPVAFEADASNSQTVNAGSYSVVEVSDTDYTTTYSNSLNGNTNCSSLVVPNGGQATCTITNNDKSPYLKLIKTVTNDNGGTASNTSWTLIATGSTTATSFQGTSGVDSTSVTNFLAGSYTLSETGPSGYTPGSWSCVGGTAIDGIIQLVLGQSATCTIDNNDSTPKLKLVKQVTNNSGGNRSATEWTLTATGPTTISGAGGVDSGASFSAGTYTLSESGPTDYTKGSWSCPGKTVTSDQIVMNLGDDITCTITNDDKPGTLIVNKVLTNDNGGTKTVQNFSYKVNGGTSVAFEADASNSQTVNAGSYSVLEVADDNYITTYSNSQNGSANCTNLSVPNGGQATCTITNDDKAPQLTLVKEVVNDNGGNRVIAEWTLTATGPTTISGAGGAVSGASFDQGTYTLSESGPTDYSKGTWSCTGKTVTNDQIVIGLGDNVRCTIINDDKAPSLTLIKHVTNDNGGTKGATDWTLSAVGPTSINGAGGATSGASFDKGTYTLGETTVADYHVGKTWSCSPVANTGTSITLELGESTTCEITNDDDPASISGTKTIANTDLSWAIDGKPPVSGWVIYLDQNQNGILDQDERSTTTDADGKYSFDGLIAGVNYYVKELLTSLGSGWAQITGVTNPVNLTLGQNSTGNDFSNEARGTITVVKNVDDGFGVISEDVSDWEWAYDGVDADKTEIATGSANRQTVPSGTYTVTETQKAGYHVTASSCNPAEPSDKLARTLNGILDPSESQEVLVGLDGDIVCAFTNTRDTGTLEVNKVVDDGYGNKTENPEGWTWHLDEAKADYDMGESKKLTTGSYTFSENVKDNYAFTALACTRDGEPFEIAQDEQATIEIGYNEAVECTFTNTRDMGDLTIFKDALPNSTQPFEFSVEPVLVDTEEEMMIAEPDEDRFTEGTAPAAFELIDSSNTAETRQKTMNLPTGWYSITETSVTGWDLTDMDCGDAEWFAYNDKQVLVYVGTGDSPECIFTNTQRAELTIVKDVQPDSTKAFSFKTNLAKDDTGADTIFSLVDDGSGLGTNAKKFSNIVPGTYTVTEDQLDGWKLDNIACTGTGVTMVRDGAKLTVSLAAGAVASCSFVNSFIPQVLAETYVLADTGNDITITVLMSTITMLLALGVTLYRRKACMA